MVWKVWILSKLASPRTASRNFLQFSPLLVSELPDCSVKRIFLLHVILPPDSLGLLFWALLPSYLAFPSFLHQSPLQLGQPLQQAFPFSGENMPVLPLFLHTLQRDRWGTGVSKSFDCVVTFPCSYNRVTIVLQ